MKHIADPSSLLLDEAAAEGYRIAGTWKEMSGFFGIGICFDIFPFLFGQQRYPRIITGF
jgi:hypothetical protein